jgi:putative heme-binding domain-containing protein
MQTLPRIMPRLLAILIGCLCLPSHAEWSWIWAQKSDANAVSLRRDFEVNAEVREATLVVSADNGATVLVNDQVALTNNDWDSPSKGDIAKYLKPGRNQMHAEAKNSGGAAGFVARLRIRYADGKESTFETDTSWEAKAAGDAAWKSAKAVAAYGSDPWGDVLAIGLPGAKPLVVQPAEVQVLPGFRVELLHVVSKADEGSWVSMTVDPAGRIIACDQYGGLFRVTPSPVGSGATSRVDRLKTQVGGAHGLLYAFNSLYVMVNEQNKRQGLWRLRDQDGDGEFESEELLRRIEGGGEHGPHAIVLSPDGHSLHIICGNHTKLPDHMETSRAVRRWEEDQIVARMWDANGHARGILAPGGYICRTDPDGKSFDLVSYGYRNAYDMAFTALGDIITYDSDMEWDAGSPWYRPTRICLATSASDLGWRSGSGKWPTYYPDSLPALVDIGPGSPTGVESGAGAKFPAKYQQAVFANDWTYGTMYAIHLAPEGAGYHAEREEFLSGRPLPLTDLKVNPVDGALYFAIGGRRTQSALYRVSYTGTESTEPAPAPQATPEHEIRRRLEAFHEGGANPEATRLAWPYLVHPDRWLRYAARAAIERQPINTWVGQALIETHPHRAIELAIALARVGPKHHLNALLDRLHGIDFAALDPSWKLALLRAYELAIIRLGPPDGATREKAIARLDALFPANSHDLNRELSYTLIALGAPSAVPKSLQLMATSRDSEITYASDALLSRNAGYADAFNKASSSRPNQLQITYAYGLRVATNGWTPALRRSYFNWFPRTAPWQGGNSFKGFLENFRKEALANVADPAERQALDALSSKKEGTGPVPDFAPPKGPGQDYTIDEILAFAGDGLKGRNFEDGRRLFHSAACFSCHRFDGAGGGVGPDLTAAASRYTLRDLLENIVEPSKVISDQYGSEQIELADGSSMIGRAYEENGRIYVVFDPRNPDEKESAELSKVKSRKPYPVSLMPAGLLNSMNRDEVINLIAYIQSAGDPKHAVFKK